MKKYFPVFSNRVQSTFKTSSFDGRIFGLFIIVASIMEAGFLIVQLCFGNILPLKLWLFLEACMGPLLCCFAFAGRKANFGAWFFLVATAIILMALVVIFFNGFFDSSIASLFLNERWGLIAPICLGIYTLCALLCIKRELTVVSLKDEWILVLSLVFLLMAAVQISVFYCRFFLFIDVIVDYRFFFVILLLLSAVVTIIYDRRVFKESNKEQHTPRKYLKSGFSNEQLEEYYQLVEDFLIRQGGFRRRDLSAQLLSAELDIPLHAFSQIFNVYLNKGFYQYVAELRISCAVEQLQTRSFNFTVEALAEECGFNSKTSFNKYFKAQMGLTPREFARTEVLKFKEV